MRQHWLTPEREKALLRRTFGPDPAPRAWDALFSERPNVYLRVHLTDGSWVAGLFAEGSYAGGHPHPTDLLLEDAWEIDADSGELGDALGYALYVPADRIQWIEVVPQAAAGEGTA